MATGMRSYGDMVVDGDFTATTMTLPNSCVGNAQVKAAAAIDRSKLAEDALVSFPIDMSNARVWDAVNTLLTATANNDDLAFVGGTFGTDQPMIKTGDLSAAGSTTRRCRFCQVDVPAEYVAGGDFQIRVIAKMDGLAADTSCTVDIEAYKVDKNDGVGSDLCTTAAQSMNSTTVANYDFTISAATLSRGDWLDVRLTIVMNDAAGYGNVQGLVCSIERRCDIQG